MKKARTSFQFDVAIGVDADRDLFHLLTEYKRSNPEDRILSCTYDHRLFNIREKNFIKALVDEFCLDHLLFTLRPSAQRLILLHDEVDSVRFKHMAQVAFVLQTIARYDIPLGVISNKYLPTIVGKTCDALTAYELLLDYLQSLLSQLPDRGRSFSLRKVFCSLFSLASLKAQLSGKRLLLREEFLAQSGNDKSELFIYENQISELEKNLFWMGFDPAFKEVPWEKAYPETKWNDLTKSASFGTPIFDKELQYCTRCCLPETMEGIAFDEFGICTPCRSSEEKMHIDWEQRDADLRRILDTNRSEVYYDCMLPMSGGKDSTFQAYVLTKRYKVSPLAVTHGHNWFSLTGRYNLETCLQQFDLDHLIFHSNRKVINKAARKSLRSIGDVCWHCHIGAGAFSIQSACKWNLGLMIWGESIAERDGRGTYVGRSEAQVYYNVEVSARIKAEDFADKDLNRDDLAQWFYPPHEVLQESRLRYLHLGDYIFWDEERHVDFIVENFEWWDSKVENTYKGYKSTECVMAGVHDYANFIKRGIGRATVHASDDVRRGLITREEGMELSKQFDPQRPHALDFYLALSEQTEAEFELTLINARGLSKDASKLKRGGNS